MGSVLSVAPTQVLSIEAYLGDAPGHSFDRSLRSTRFLKTARTRFKQTMKVVKVFVKQNTSLSLTDHIEEIERIKKALEDNYNVQTFQAILETERSAILVRQFFFSNLYDKLSTRPLLNPDEKLWIIFQLLQGLHLSHNRGVCHGDIKIDNVLLTSWNWVYLSDFASFKPTELPVDNPAAFSYFFDTSGRQSCGLAPERFYTPDKIEGGDSHICRFGDQMRLYQTQQQALMVEACT